MVDDPVILQSREASSMVSTWTEYLCVTNVKPGKARLEVCMYEALAEFDSTDDDGNEIAVPETYDGKRVIGVDDGYLIGGELMALDDKTITYTRDDIEKVLAWVKKLRFEAGPKMKEALLAGLGES